MAHASKKQKTKAAPSDDRCIPCRAVPGMFRDEYLVFLEAVDPAAPDRIIRVQMLVDRDLVLDLEEEPARNHPVRGWVRVFLAGAANGLARVILPQPAVPVGTWMLIDEKLVRREVHHDPV